MEQSTRVAGLDSVSAPHFVVLRLRRGASPWGLCAFHQQDIGETLTVGAAPCCDWQIASAGVPALAAQVLFTGDSLRVRRAAPDAGVRVNGEPLTAGWTLIRHGDRLELGSACIEACYPQAERDRAVPAAGDHRPPAPRTDIGTDASFAVPQRVLDLDDDVLDELNSDLPEDMRGPSLDPLEPPASVLGRDKDQGPNLPRRYALMGLITACAYTGWVVLLDWL